jgi:predicted AAA+ superfamily ATPase
MLAGPRQSGKTTLARLIAGDGMPFVTLDDATTRSGALADPTGFVRRLDRAVIDEVQRSPDLLLAIKSSVDADPRPGRFFLTGSANLMTLPRVADSLAGRMEVINLLPLAQAEIRWGRPSLLEHLFRCEVPIVQTPVIGEDLVYAVLSGGYPEALNRKSWGRRQDWYLDYIDAIVQRDVRDIAQVEQVGQMPRLLRVLAEHSGQLANASAVGAPLGMNHVTTQRYIRIFENLFLVRMVQPWFSNGLKRLTKTSKVHFLDAGLLAALRGVSPDRVRRDRSVFGAILETFVLGEVLKMLGWSEERLTVSYFRDKEQNEVDIVLENRQGQVVGVEVKAASTVTRADFHGMRRLAAGAGQRFVLGMVLYDHDQVVPFGDRMFAVPLSVLWG